MFIRQIYPTIFTYFGIERCYINISNNDVEDSYGKLYIQFDSYDNIRFFINKYNDTLVLKGIEMEYEYINYINNINIIWLHESNLTIILFEKKYKNEINNIEYKSDDSYLNKTNELMESKTDYLEQVIEHNEICIYMYKYKENDCISKIIMREYVKNHKVVNR
jgi:hypothetical protein